MERGLMGGVLWDERVLTNTGDTRDTSSRCSRNPIADWFNTHKGKILYGCQSLLRCLYGGVVLHSEAEIFGGTPQCCPILFLFSEGGL